MSIELMMPSNRFIICRPLIFMPSICPSINVFSNELALHLRWPKYCSFSISLFSEYLGLISFKIDWFDLLFVQRTLKFLLQHHHSKATIRCSAFFMVQLSHPFTMWGHSKKALVCKPGNGLTRHQICWHLDPGLLSLQTVKNKCCLNHSGYSIQYSSPSWQQFTSENYTQKITIRWLKSYLIYLCALCVCVCGVWCMYSCLGKVINYSTRLIVVILGLLSMGNYCFHIYTFLWYSNFLHWSVNLIYWSSYLGKIKPTVLRAG